MTAPVQDKRHGMAPQSEAEGEKPITVLYIAGSSRTGSTILANTLGQVDGFFAVGELWNLWRRGLIENRMCGCGLPFGDCPIWRAVLLRAFERYPDGDRAEHLRELTLRRLRHHWVRSVLDARTVSAPVGDEYRTALAALYAAVRDTTGCNVVVDSSKCPIYATLLASIPGFRLHVVHLVRDARAAAFSNRRVRELPDIGDHRLMAREHPLVTARRWAKNLLLSELLLPRRAASFTEVRYEDFMTAPAATIAPILAAVGQSTDLTWTAENTLEMHPTHSVSGNPGRFHTGQVTLRFDNEWMRAMRARDRAVVEAVTWPLLIKHGYPLIVHRRRSGSRG